MKNALNYYYKCPSTGIEMNFTKTDGWGWGVSFPVKGDHVKMRFDDVKIPWPSLSDEEQAEVDENYRILNEHYKNE